MQENASKQKMMFLMKFKKVLNSDLNETVFAPRKDKHIAWELFLMWFLRLNSSWFQCLIYLNSVDCLCCNFSSNKRQTNWHAQGTVSAKLRLVWF